MSLKMNLTHSWIKEEAVRKGLNRIWADGHKYVSHSDDQNNAKVIATHFMKKSK